MKKIGVVGAGLVGSCFKGLEGYEVVHRNEWKDKIRGWAGVVNCAGIVGLQVCEDTDFTQVLCANAKMPIDMADYSADLQIPFVQFSTSAVYRHPAKQGDPVDEHSPLYPYNAYAGSKILMEATLPPSCYIFRIPVVSTESGADNDLEQKVNRWKVVEDVLISIVYKDVLLKAVRNAITGEIPAGIYNIASEAVHLPSYVEKQFGWTGEVVPANSLSRSPAIVLDITKARKVGLI